MIVVIGLGNPLRSDEGIGIRLIQEMRQRIPEAMRAQVRLLDLGTSGMRLLEAFHDADRAVIIDCAFMGREPGTMVRFSRSEVQSVRQTSNLSLHDSDLMHIVDLAERLGECPGELVFFGVEPKSLDYGMELSPALATNLDAYLQAIEREISDAD